MKDRFKMKTIIDAFSQTLMDGPNNKTRSICLQSPEYAFSYACLEDLARKDLRQAIKEDYGSYLTYRILIEESLYRNEVSKRGCRPSECVYFYVVNTLLDVKIIVLYNNDVVQNVIFSFVPINIFKVEVI